MMATVAASDSIIGSSMVGASESEDEPSLLFTLAKVQPSEKEKAETLEQQERQEARREKPERKKSLDVEDLSLTQDSKREPKTTRAQRKLQLQSSFSKLDAYDVALESQDSFVALQTSATSLELQDSFETFQTSATSCNSSWWSLASWGSDVEQDNTEAWPTQDDLMSPQGKSKSLRQEARPLKKKKKYKRKSSTATRKTKTIQAKSLEGVEDPKQKRKRKKKAKKIKAKNIDDTKSKKKKRKSSKKTIRMVDAPGTSATDLFSATYAGRKDKDKSSKITKSFSPMKLESKEFSNYVLARQGMASDEQHHASHPWWKSGLPTRLGALRVRKDTRPSKYHQLGKNEQ